VSYSICRSGSVSDLLQLSYHDDSRRCLQDRANGVPSLRHQPLAYIGACQTDIAGPFREVLGT